MKRYFKPKVLILVLLLFPFTSSIKNKKGIDELDESISDNCGDEGDACYSEAHTQGTCCKGLLCEWYNVGSGVCSKIY